MKIILGMGRNGTLGAEVWVPMETISAHVATYDEPRVLAYILGTFRFITVIFSYRFVRIQDKLRKAVGSLEFFTSSEWKFDNANLFMLEGLLSSDDKKASQMHICSNVYILQRTMQPDKTLYINISCRTKI